MSLRSTRVTGHGLFYFFRFIYPVSFLVSCFSMQKESKYLRIKLWRDAQPWLEKECEHCGGRFRTRFGRFCRATCRSAAHKAARRAAAPTLLCDLCSVPLGKKRTRFCSDAHKRRFWALRRAGKPIPVRVSAATLLYTHKYDEIAAVRRAWFERQDRPY